MFDLTLIQLKVLLRTPVFSGVCVTRSLVLCVMFCRSLIVLFYFFLWPLCCLFLFDLRILITTLVSSNSSYARLSFRYGSLMTVLSLHSLDIKYRLQQVIISHYLVRSGHLLGVAPWSLSR